MKLTQRTVAGLELPHDKEEQFFWDAEIKGFGFRLRGGDGKRLSRTWVTQYRAKGRLRRSTLGDFEKLTAEQARQAAKAMLGRVALGEDPQGEKQRQRLGAARTLRSVADDYLAMKQDALRPASLRMARLYLLGPYFKPLHSSAITDIMRADIAPRLNAMN